MQAQTIQKNNLKKKMRTVVLLISILLLAACSTPNKEVESTFVQADSLMELHPDSALHLLKALPTLQKLSRNESARYALLLARATDKCAQPLLPCDSLLDIALDYYDDDDRDRAVALLYKGRLEVEMAQSERAITFFLEGVNIIKKFPEEIETKRHLLSSLGNEYFDARLYEKAKETYEELYEYCFTDKDKAIAFSRLGAYYYATEKTDSAIFYNKKALHYAQISRDSSIIEMFAGSLSREYCWEEQYDTALHYAKMSLQWLPQNEKRYTNYNNIGNIFYYKDDLDSSIYYMNKCLEDSIYFKSKEKAGILLDLANIKEEQKDYQASTKLLNQFIEIADSVYFTDPSTQIQQLIHQFDIKKKVEQEKIKNATRLKNVIGCFLIFCLVIIVFFQYRINKRDKLKVINEERLRQAQERYSNLQHFIDESQRIITLLQQKQSDFIQEAEMHKQEIAERETTIEKLKTEKEELRTWLFKQSNIYKKVAKLAEQKVANKKELAVLTNSEQKKLKDIVMDIYDDYISNAKAQYPLLTDEDLLYLCLEKAGLSNQTISLCFGNTDTHALAQRKYRIKERMNRGK